jgi:hypothetical protein
MRIIIAILLAALCFAEPIVRKELINNLRMTAKWEVTNYEENVFKGMDSEDLPENDKPVLDVDDLPRVTLAKSVPTHINWAEKSASCVHGIKNQGDCTGASFAFAVAGMVSDRCCLKGTDHGWLSAMELVSCSAENYGCAGGWPVWAAQYVATNGLVDEACYPYNAKNEDCPEKCKTATDWKAAHICKCTNPTTLKTLADLKSALSVGPAVVTFEAFDDLYTYKSGIYCHTAGRFRRLVSARVTGYSEEGAPHLILAMPFGEEFGEKGYLRMCTSCCGLFSKYEKGNVACTIA